MAWRHLLRSSKSIMLFECCCCDCQKGPLVPQDRSGPPPPHGGCRVLSQHPYGDRRAGVAALLHPAERLPLALQRAMLLDATRRRQPCLRGQAPRGYNKPAHLKVCGFKVHGQSPRRPADARIRQSDMAPAELSALPWSARFTWVEATAAAEAAIGSVQSADRLGCRAHPAAGGQSGGCGTS